VYEQEKLNQYTIEIFHGNFPEAGRFRELDHKQYELK
jgi:hypothetical protein